MTDGTKRDLYHPVVEADSLKGVPPHQPDPEYYDALVYAIPLDQVITVSKVSRVLQLHDKYAYRHLRCPVGESVSATC